MGASWIAAPGLASCMGCHHTAGMIESMLPLLVAGVVVALWLDALAARETAAFRSRRLCEESGLQWLDQSIVLQRIGLVRVDGRLALKRSYRFEVSFDGSDRHQASISLHGRRVANYTLPVREQAVSVPLQIRSFPT
jgi:hypothetical protein